MDASSASSDASHAPVDVAIDASVVDASPAVQHPTPAERKRYGDALVRGRAATVAKDWLVLRADNGNLHVTGAGCNIKTPRPDHPTE